MIWSRYLAGVLMAWMLLVRQAGLDDASLCFVVALVLGWPLSALLLIIEPYLDPHFEAWVYGDAPRDEDPPGRPVPQKVPPPGSIGSRLPD